MFFEYNQDYTLGNGNDIEYLPSIFSGKIIDKEDLR